jgi:hypothetical protein
MTVSENSLQATVDDVTAGDAGVTIRLTLENSADRALHYIAGVRAVAYAPETGQLTVRLTDVGRAVVPGGANIAPVMQFVEPESSVELAIELPAEIVQLAPAADGDLKRVAFVRHRIADTTRIRVELAWADVPFYEDPRSSAELQMPSVDWQQHLLAVLWERD